MKHATPWPIHPIPYDLKGYSHSFRPLLAGIPIFTRYLFTVRRAVWIPWRSNASQMAWSLRGCRLSSPWMVCLISCWRVFFCREALANGSGSGSFSLSRIRFPRYTSWSVSCQAGPVTSLGNSRRGLASTASWTYWSSSRAPSWSSFIYWNR